jgi:hypothetical protein
VLVLNFGQRGASCDDASSISLQKLKTQVVVLGVSVDEDEAAYKASSAPAFPSSPRDGAASAPVRYVPVSKRT